MAGINNMAEARNAAEAEEYLRWSFSVNRVRELGREFAESAGVAQGHLRAAIARCLGELSDLNSSWYRQGEDSAVTLLSLARQTGVDARSRKNVLTALDRISPEVGPDLYRMVVRTMVASLDDDEVSGDFVNDHLNKYSVERLMEVAGNMGDALVMVEAFHGPEEALNLAQEQMVRGADNVPLLLSGVVLGSKLQEDWRALLRSIALAGRSSTVSPLLVEAIQRGLGERERRERQSSGAPMAIAS